MSEYRAVELDGKGTRVHRATCKRAPERAVAVTEDDLRVWARPIVPATCCKPQLRQPVTAGWQTEATAQPQTQPQPHTDRVKRAAAAKGEGRAIGLWARSPKATRGPRPSTVNLDAIDAEAAAAERTTTGARAGNGGTTRSRGPLTERQAKVKAIMDGNVAAGHSATWRPERGKRLTDDELATYMRQARTEHPDEGKTQLYNWAYFVDRLAITYERWMANWPTTQP
jgi:hypothetical protein